MPVTMERDFSRILYCQMLVYLPITLKVNSEYTLQIRYKLNSKALEFAYFKKEGELDSSPKPKVDYLASFQVSKTFMSQVLAGWTEISKDYAKLSAYLAFVISTWARALSQFVFTLSEYELMALKPEFFLPPPSKSPFYLKTFQDFQKAVNKWTKIFKERSLNV